MKTETSAVNIDRSKGDFFYPEAHVRDAGAGLSERTVRYISDVKEDPDWVREFRLRGLRTFLEKPLPTHWASKDLEAIDFDKIRYYLSPGTETKRSWEEVPDDIKRTFERLDVIWHFFPASFRLGPGREIVTDFVEIDGFEILARPVRRERFFQECPQAAQAELAHPIRVLFDVRDVANSPLAQSGARIAHVSFRIKEISFASINIDGRSFGFHCVFSPCLSKRWFNRPFARPIVSSLFKL